MKAAQPKPADDLHICGAEFGRLMGKALQVRSAQVPQPKSRANKVTKSREPAKKMQPK